ncbi:MAG: alpha/beta hydrolase [Spirochaetales bacterium]|nr:alpha/beta hydrolase [Spirochaetales bacterium]
MNKINFNLIENTNTVLTAYLSDEENLDSSGGKHPAMIVCPGGGYQLIAGIEGEPVALAYKNAGYKVFVLNYSVGIENPFPTAVQELATAISLVRKNAESWGIDSDDISLTGFSAGGHLSLSLASFMYDKVITEELGLSTEDIKPNNLVLGYPSVTLSTKRTTEPGIAEILSGKLNPSEEEKKRFNLMNKIHKDIPRTFIWGTAEDNIIPATDYLELTSNLYSLGVDCEFHFYQKGGHAMSLGTTEVRSDVDVARLHIDTWFNMALKWLKEGRE